jgi:hypothetical protein
MKNLCYFVINSNEVKFPTVYSYPDFGANLKSNLDFIPRIGEKVQLDCRTLFNDEKIKSMMEDRSSIFKIFPKLEKEKPIQYRKRLYKFLGKHIEEEYFRYDLYDRIPYIDLMSYFLSWVFFECVVTDVKTLMKRKNDDEISQTVIIYLKDTADNNGE